MTHSTQTEPVTAAPGEPPERSPRGRWRRLRPVIVALTAAVVVVFVVLEAPSISHGLATTFGHFEPRRLPWLLLALAAEAASFLCYALVQRRLLLHGGARLTRRTMVALAVGATGLTNLVPGGTAPASGWLVGQYRRRGVPMPLALWAVLAGGFAATVSVLLVLLLGAGIAGLIGLPAALGCLALMLLVVTALLFALRRLDPLQRWLAARRSTRTLRLVQRVVTPTAGVLRFRPSVPTGVHVLGFSLANWALDVMCLAASFALLGLPVPWHAVLFAYATAQIAGSLAPVPGGIGFVEGGMVGAFALAGTPAGAALAATVVYRLITCWAVAAVGSLALLIISRRPPCPPAQLDGDAAALARSSGDILTTPAGTPPARGRRPGA